MNERTQPEQGFEHKTTADLAGMTPEQPRSNGGPGGTAPGNGAATHGTNGENGHAVATAPGTAPQTERGNSAEDGTRTPLLQKNDSEALHTRWVEVQTRFVDDPRRAVQDADAMVAELMQRLARMFADERSGLERQWSAGSEVSTEDLRMALRRYRSFFERLLNV